jgi:hypothetical protein
VLLRPLAKSKESYWKDDIRKELTEKQVTLDEVDRVELVCQGQLVNHSPAPTSKPTPTKTPEKTVVDIITQLYIENSAGNIYLKDCIIAFTLI